MQNNTQHLNKNMQQLIWPRTQFLILHQSRRTGAAFFHFFLFLFLEVHPTSVEPKKKEKKSRLENLRFMRIFLLEKKKNFSFVSKNFSGTCIPYNRKTFLTGQRLFLFSHDLLLGTMHYFLAFQVFFFSFFIPPTLLSLPWR